MTIQDSFFNSFEKQDVICLAIKNTDEVRSFAWQLEVKEAL